MPRPWSHLHFTVLIDHLSYNIPLKQCVIDKRLLPAVAVFAGTVKQHCLAVRFSSLFLKLLFDIFLFVLMYWNALDRPRHMHVTVAKILYRDGAIYFVVWYLVCHISAILPNQRWSLFRSPQVCLKYSSSTCYFVDYCSNSALRLFNIFVIAFANVSLITLSRVSITEQGTFHRPLIFCLVFSVSSRYSSALFNKFWPLV